MCGKDDHVITVKKKRHRNGHKFTKLLLGYSRTSNIFEHEPEANSSMKWRRIIETYKIGYALYVVFVLPIV